MGIIKKQSIVATIINYIGVLVGFFNSAVLLPALFSSEEVGLLGFLTSLTAIFATIATFGIPLITGKMFPAFRSEDGNNGFFTLTVVGSVFGIAIGLATYFLLENWIISENNNAKDFSYFALIFSVVFAARLLYKNFDSYLRMLYQTVIGAALDNLGTKTIILIGLSLVWFIPGISFTAIFILYGIALAFPGIVLLFYLLKQNISFNPSKFKKRLGGQKRAMLLLGLFGILGGIGSTIVIEVDRIMVSNMLGLSATGIYQVAFFFGAFISIPSRGLKRISTVIVADAFEEDDLDKIQTIYQKSCVNQLLIAGYLFLGIWFSISSIFTFMKPEYAAGLYVVLFIGLSQLVDMATGISAEILTVSKYYSYNTYFALVLVVLVVLLNFIFIPIWGINGAAFASFIAMVLINALRFIFLYWKFKLQPFNLKMLINLGLIALIFLGMSFFPNLGNPILTILVSGSIITLVYWFLAYQLELSHDINQTWKNIAKRFFGR